MRFNFSRTIGIVICLSLLYSVSAFSQEEEVVSSPQKEHLGFQWEVELDAFSHYLFRGQYCGGLSFQPSVTLSYEGVYVNVWYNAGATDWTFKEYNNELDLTFGFARWGLDVYLHFVNTYDGYKIFDMSHSAEKVNSGCGNTADIDISYTISEKIPLTILWSTNFFATDGYSRMHHGHAPAEDDADVKRAFSSLIQIGYSFSLPHELVLDARVDITPWKSCYTNYEGNFACTYVGATLSRSWQLQDHCTITPQMELCLNPYKVNKYNLVREIGNRSDQRFNLAIGVGITFN